MNPLAIRIAADLKAFKANMDEMRVQLETNQAAMKRMANAFDGNKVIGDANAMVKAIHDIGGAAALTEAEQRRVNATVTEAISKYKVLGREAPPELLALRDATNKVEAATRQVEAPVDSLSTRLKGLAGTLGIAFTGAAVVSGIKALISNTFEYAETIKDTSAKLAISMEATQRFKFAAEQTGASLENVSKSILKLSQGVAGGDKGLKEALESAGIQFEALKGMKPEDAFNTVAEAIAKIPDPMTQADVALAAFGKSGAELLPALREGFVDISREVKVMSDATINALDSAKDKWEEFSNKVTVATGGIVAKILGMMEKIAPAMQLLLTLGGQNDAAEMWGVFVAGADKAKASIDALTASQKLAASALLKQGESVQQVAKYLVVSEASVQAYVKSLEQVPPVVTRVGTTHSTAAKEVDKFKMSLPGVKESDGIVAFLNSIRVGSDQVVGSLPAATKAVSDFLAVGQKVKLSLPPIVLPGVEPQTAAQWVEEITKRMKEAGASGGSGFIASFAKALEGLGSVIVGAIQGGGDVARAAGAHLGLSIGNEIAKNMADQLTNALGKTLGSVVGGFLGPVGALVGGWVGGLFGKNQGREDAKAFAERFGGFDALREKMLMLGAEGDKLWIALTQNTKGPKQVAETIKLIEDALRAAEEQAKKTGKELEDTFKGPEGARGFPTRAQLQKAADEAKAAYDYMAASGEYTADVLEQAWQQWQDAMIASGDETAKRMKDLTAEITSLQKAVEMETPEYDAEGVRIYGVEELRNIQRLEALEKEKAALTLARIEEETHATEEAAAKADLQAQKEFDAAKIRALDLDGYLRKLFSGGYEIPLSYRLPDGSTVGPPTAPAGSSPSFFGNGTLPSGPGRTVQPVTINVVSQLDGQVVAQNQVKYIPRELDFIGG